LSPYDTSMGYVSKEPIYLAGFQGTTWLVEGWPVPNCSVECYFDRDGGNQALLKKSHGIFYGSRSNFYDPKKISILYCSESDSLYPFQRTEYDHLGIYFNMSVSYHQEKDSIIQKQKREGKKFTHLGWSYAPYLLPAFFDKPVPFKEKSQEVIATIFMSNCGSTNSNRAEYLKQLMEVIPIHSFGRCMNNISPHSVPDCHNQAGNQHIYEEKMCIIRKYKFYLAFENSIDESYVTEKYWQSLRAGAVPVIIGAPNVDDFFPTEGTVGGLSAIKVSDFKSAKELGNFLKELAGDETRYNKYLEWKTKPAAPNFKKLVETSLDFVSTVCQICVHVAKELNLLKS